MAPSVMTLICEVTSDGFSLMGLEKINWADRVRNEDVRRNTIRRIKRTVNWVGHIWRRNCLLTPDIEGRTEGRIGVTGRRRRKRKQLLGDLKGRKSTADCKKKH